MNLTARSAHRMLVSVAAVGLAGIVVACSASPPAPSPGGTAARTVSPSPVPSPSETGVDPDAALQELIDLWAAGNDPVGVSAAVLYPDGHLWLGTSGLADRDRHEPIEPADRFEVASITKTFMSALALLLAEEGLVDLDTPIDSCLPEYPAADTITMRMLLGHRAGVFDPSAELVTDRFGPPDPERVFTAAELIEASASGTPTFLPGSSHEYTNAGYWVLAACLEAVTGQPVATMLDERIVRPLGLSRTLLYDETLPEVEVVNAYKDLDLDGTEDPMGTRPLPGFITPAWTAGGVISTAEDLVRFLDALFADELLNDASLDAMLDGSSGGGSYALGIYRNGNLWGHDGGIAGYLSAAFHDRASGISVAVLTNRFGPDAPQADALAPRLASLARELDGVGGTSGS